jgi:hypothetical protein
VLVYGKKERHLTGMVLVQRHVFNTKQEKNEISKMSKAKKKEKNFLRGQSLTYFETCLKGGKMIAALFRVLINDLITCWLRWPGILFV